MLDDVREVYILRIHAGFGQRAPEQLSGRTDERMTLTIFGIARFSVDAAQR